MSTLISYGKEIKSVFQLLGYKGNDITLSISWALSKCPEFMKSIIQKIFKIQVNSENIIVLNQQYDSNTGITDIEIKDNNIFHVIFEAKRGWILPEAAQLTSYSLREDFINSPVKNKAIVTLSECSQAYANINLPFKKTSNGIRVQHFSWKDIYELADSSILDSNHQQKHLLQELKEYLGGIITMQHKESNWVYVVALSEGHADDCSLTWIDIVKKHNKYFCPVGGNGWPKEPPNYIAFRYSGKLQAIHHIDDYVITNNIHDEIPEMPNEIWNNIHYIYKLGPKILPSKIVKTGKIYPSGRVWAMLDTLLTSDTISEARDISKQRMQY
ncbi:hypothetical protein [Clostridium butyricum]|uniref:hypothetical protein n=1 Tax=Clostridium butyricum TaxID=1492 RepID=UPI00374F36C3